MQKTSPKWLPSTAAVSIFGRLNLNYCRYPLIEPVKDMECFISECGTDERVETGKILYMVIDPCALRTSLTCLSDRDLTPLGWAVLCKDFY